MFGKAISTAALALLASNLVSAQTFTDCNPLKKTCPADKALTGTTECDFTKGECDVFSHADGTTIDYDGSKGAVFTIEKESNAPTIHTENYIFFGRVDVVAQAANGQGIVTSVVLQSDDLDEIDWEWVGGDNAQVQTNYYSKGDTTTYDRGAYHPVSEPLTTFHKYSIEWTKTAVTWSIDDNVVRTLNAAEAKGGEAYPQTPSQVKLGTWCAGGKNTPEGTVEWAGGYTNFDEAPFNAYYKSIKIVDYAGGDGPSKKGSVKEYVYGDNSGSWESIKLVKGDGSSDDDEKTSTKASKTATATKTEDDATTTTTKAASKTTESAAETTEAKTSTKVQTTFTTAAATTADSDSGASPSATEGGDSASSTEAPETIPTGSATRMAGSILAVLGLVAVQLL